MRIALTAVTAATTLTLTGCSAASPSTPATPPAAPAASVAPLPSEPPTVSVPPDPAPTTSEQPAVKRIKIPDVVGVNHQTAQDTMQAAGLFNLHEKDATGQGRLLIWDRNWVVVRQSPPAGRRVTPETAITLYSKKIGE